MTGPPTARHPLDPRGSGAHLPADPDELVDRQRLARLAAWIIDQWSATLDSRGYVYAVQVLDDGPVKIGMTYDPLARLADLQHASPYPLAIRAVMLGWAEAERRILMRWALHRIRGEWFEAAAAAPLIAFVRGAGIAQVIAFENGETNASFLANTLPFGTQR